MKMKKVIILVCCVIIASMGIVLTGCGNSSSDKDTESSSVTNAESSSVKDDENPYVGTWEAKGTIEKDGVEYDVTEVLGGTMEITFNEDGTCLVMQKGESEDGTWKTTKDGLTLTSSKGFEFIFIYDDGKLLWEVVAGEDGVPFEKKK